MTTRALVSEAAGIRTWLVSDIEGNAVGWDVEPIAADPDPTGARIAELEAQIEELTRAMLQ